MKIRIIYILIFIFACRTATAQYHDMYMIHDGTGLFSDREPFKTLLQNDLDIIKKNKVKEIKVKHENGSYLKYKITEQGFPSEINVNTYFGYRFALQISFYYNIGNKTDSIVYKNFIPGSVKAKKHSTHFFYNDNKLKYIAKSSNDTIYWIDYYFYDKITKRDTFFSKNMLLREKLYTADMLVRLYDSTVYIEDYSTRQWTQTDSVFLSGDTIINRQNKFLDYKIFLKDNRIVREEGTRRVISYHSLEYERYDPTAYSYFYRNDGLIDYIIMNDQNNFSRKVKFNYEFY